MRRQLIMAYVAVALAGVLTIAYGRTSWAQPIEKALEDGLKMAMMFNPSSKERLADSGTIIRQYIKHKYVDRKPDERFDYTDYRFLKKPAYFMGHRILVIEEEYFSQWVGCCVSPGIGIIVELGGQIENLEKFTRSNHCSISDASNDIDMLGIAHMKDLNKWYASISCRERDVP